MAARRIRAILLVALPFALLHAAPALARPAGHSSLVPLPSVLPPTPLPGGMRWTREDAGLRPAAPADYRRGRAVVGVAAGVDGRRLAASLRLRPVEWLPALRLVEVAGNPASLAALARSVDPRIRYVEPLVAGRVAHVRNDPLTYEIDPATGVPYEWQFHAVGADQALNLAKGDPSMLVGVVDSGISPVPDLAGKIAETFWDPSATRSAIDALGHGTFVASIIAARNDDGFGLAGFCGACRLAIYKASPLTDVQVAEGIRTLTDAHVRVINLSVVLDSPSQAVTDALDYATAAGVLVVAASGNEGADSIDFPASYLQPSDGVPSRPRGRRLRPGGGPGELLERRSRALARRPGDSHLELQLGHHRRDSRLRARLRRRRLLLGHPAPRSGRGALRLRERHELRRARGGGDGGARLVAEAVADERPGRLDPRADGDPTGRDRLDAGRRRGRPQRERRRRERCRPLERRLDRPRRP